MNNKKDVDGFISQVLSTIDGAKCISKLIIKSDNEGAANTAVAVAHYFDLIERQIAELQHAYETEKRLRVIG